MKKILYLSITSCLINSSFALNSAAIIKADKAYNSGNVTSLYTTYSANTKDDIIAYLYAKAMLTKNEASVAEHYVNTHHDSYMRNALIHNLLIFYYNNENYSEYISKYKKLKPENISTNEKCGYDVASYNATDKTYAMNNQWLISNKVPTWCADLGALQYNRGKINKSQLDYMLYNLIANDRTEIFNQIAKSIKLTPIAFDKYKNTPVGKLKEDRNYKYLVVNRVTGLAYKYPDVALQEMKDADIDSSTRDFLGTYIAKRFALKHEFSKALSLYSKYEHENMSDEEYEWRTRTYMYFGKWSKVVDSIDSMPEKLGQKNAWLYWKGRAYQSLGKKETAMMLYEQIPEDRSFYSLLAVSHLYNGIEFSKNPPSTTKLSDSNYAEQAKDALKLYDIADSNSSENLKGIANAAWNYAAKNASEHDKLSMSNLALNDKQYSMSIFASNQMETPYIELSFPTPFLSTYKKYATENGIPVSYTLGISRQESRFNYKVIAFDGGVGLMQIMPQTAQYISKKMGSSNCYRSGYDCNIKFGSWYIGSLFYKFNHNIIYATAGYNAGPTRARRWQDTLGKLDNIVQIELIPIDITRDYVQKVLTNKAAYEAVFEHQNTLNLYSYFEKMSKSHYLEQPDDDHTDAQKLND